MLGFFQIEGMWQPCVEQVVGVIFQQHGCLCVFVSHFDNSLNISNFSIIIVFVRVICDQ